MPAKNKTAPSADIHLTRIYDAPVKTVWEAFTDPSHVAKWWGPRGFTLTTHEKDLKPGGHWNYTMHGPDGRDYENVTLYHEVIPHSKLVYDHGATKNTPPLFRVTVLFTEIKGNKTKMDMTMSLPTPEAAAETRKFIKQAGGNSTWDRLAEYLDKQSAGKERFYINRTFDAPVEQVFEMWANPDHLKNWLAPTGMTMHILRADIRPGGANFYKMEGASVTLHGRIEYLKIEKPHLISYTQQFCDENEKVTRHPMAPTWPETMLTVVTFAEEESGQTRITVCWEVVGHVTDEEMRTFIAEKGGMTQGWTGSFDKLEAYLDR